MTLALAVILAVGLEVTGTGLNCGQPEKSLPTPISGSPLTLMVAEHLHAGLCVGVVGRLEAQLGDTWARETGEQRAGG